MNVAFSDFLDPHRCDGMRRPSSGPWILTLYLALFFPSPALLHTAGADTCEHLIPHIQTASSAWTLQGQEGCTLRLWVVLGEGSWGRDIFKPWKWVWGKLGKKIPGPAHLLVILEGNVLGKNLETRCTDCLTLMLPGLSPGIT